MRISIGILLRWATAAFSTGKTQRCVEGVSSEGID